MIQHDQPSRWKLWMRMLAVDIRPISVGMFKSPSLSIGVSGDVEREFIFPRPKEIEVGAEIIILRHC